MASSAIKMKTGSVDRDDFLNTKLELQLHVVLFIKYYRAVARQALLGGGGGGCGLQIYLIKKFLPEIL